MHTNRPTTVIPPRPIAPQPRWQGLFLEPIYADGLPDQPAAGGQLEDEDEHEAA